VHLRLLSPLLHRERWMWWACPLVTIGPKASVETQRLFEGGEYTRYLYLGLSVETAEPWREFHHKKMRGRVRHSGRGLAADSRSLPSEVSRVAVFVWLSGVSAPGRSDKLFALLKPEENVGVRLTSGFLLEPEQSTSAIVVHHPGAKLFCGVR